MLKTRDHLAALEAISSLGSAVCLIDVEDGDVFRIFALNQRAEQELGVSHTRVAGRRLDEALPARQAARLAHQYRRCVEQRRLVEYVAHADDATGRRYSLNTLVPLEDEDERIFRLLETSVEITGQKRARERAERLERQLRDTLPLAAFGRRAGSLVHELKNRLSVVRGYAEWTIQEVESGCPSAARARKVLTAAERAVARAREILDSMQMGHGSAQDVDLVRLVRESGAVIEPLLGDSIALELQFKSEQAWVHADASELEQVLMELVLNAHDAMPEGGTLTITVTADEELVRLAVRDTGVGMDARTRAKACDPFFTTKGWGTGTGLGLCSVDDVVRHWGGELHVHSQAGAGALFEVFLPRRKE